MSFQIFNGDCRQTLKQFTDNSIDAIVTDPPYELGFMGKGWDKSGIANDVTLWRECLRVLKPGGHLLAFSGSRTYHRMTCAIEDAGFEVRDQMMWVYGSGFPKSHNVGKKLDGTLGNQSSGFNTAGGKENFDKQNKSFRSDYGYKYEPLTENGKKWDGWGTALKPAHEPICLARKPLEGTVADNVLKWGVGALNVKQTKVGGESGRWPANLMHDGSDEVLDLFPETKSPAPYFEKSEKLAMWKVKRFSNKLSTHHGDSGSAARFFYCPKASKHDRDEGLDEFEEKRESDRIKDDGVVGDNPRNRTNKPRRNTHPTVKPTELMRYLCRLITPPNGTILDPFMGSGSTGKAAILEGYKFIGCELSEDYIKIATARIQSAII